MSKTPLNSPHTKLSILGSLMGSSQYKTTTFRLKRNKWTLIKLFLFTSFTIYILLFLKSLIFLDQHQKTQEIRTLSTSDSQKLNYNDNEYILVTQDPFINPKTGSTRHIERMKALPQINNPYSKRRKPITDVFEARKKRLDERLKVLYPIQEGWGEHGHGVYLNSTEERNLAEDQFKLAGFNVYISDRISPNRSIDFVAPDDCKNITYDVEELPHISVIIIYTNEIFSALVRTIWSVYNRTPKNMLREIILVDDNSDRDYLKQTLTDYVDIYLNTLPRHHSFKDQLVKIYRQDKRIGLIKARLVGAEHATGEILVFLDSHCEVTELWAQPLAKRIKENRHAFVTPVIDIINDKDMEYYPVDGINFQIGGFDWTGQFNWIARSPKKRSKNVTDTVNSPTMAGGLFAVDRKYFYEIGSYDDKMEIWGGENLEMSFRVWQCGGSVEIHPCSRVGHIFRDYHPYSFNGKDAHGFNTLRTVKVWMDDYARYFFLNRPDLRDVDPGDLRDRLELRKRLNCKSFEWYLENIYENRKFIYDKDVQAYGYIRNEVSNLCFDVLNREELKSNHAGVYTCEKMKHPLEMMTNQLFSYTNERKLRRDESCLSISLKDLKLNHATVTTTEDEEDDYESKTPAAKVYMVRCEPRVNMKNRRKLNVYRRQLWDVEPVDGHPNKWLIVNNKTSLCISAEGLRSQADLQVTVCDKHNEYQHWEFQVSNLDKPKLHTNDI